MATWEIILDHMKHDWAKEQERDDVTCPTTFGLTLFRKIRKENFPDVKMSKKSRLGKCEECIRLSAAMRNGKDQRAREEARVQKGQHLALNKAERVAMTAREQEAAKNAFLLRVYACDAPTPIQTPHCLPERKGWFRASKVSLQMTCLYDFAYKQRIFVLYYKRWKLDSNFMCTVHMYFLRKLACERHRPAKIYLHLDNCCSENKNWDLLGLLCCVVEWGWFVDVRLYYLLPAHGHMNKTDGGFGTLRCVMKDKQEIISPVDHCEVRTCIKRCRCYRC